MGATSGQVLFIDELHAGNQSRMCYGERGHQVVESRRFISRGGHLLESWWEIRISGFSSISPGLVSIVRGLLGQLKLIIPVGFGSAKFKSIEI